MYLDDRLFTLYEKGQVFTDNFSLTEICHRNFSNEFAFTHSKDYLAHR